MSQFGIIGVAHGGISKGIVVLLVTPFFWQVFTMLGTTFRSRP